MSHRIWFSSGLPHFNTWQYHLCGILSSKVPDFLWTPFSLPALTCCPSLVLNTLLQKRAPHPSLLFTFTSQRSFSPPSHPCVVTSNPLTTEAAVTLHLIAQRVLDAQGPPMSLALSPLLFSFQAPDLPHFWSYLQADLPLPPQPSLKSRSFQKISTKPL